MAWKKTMAGAAALTALLWLAPAPASAALITLNLSFSGTSFVDELGASAAPSASVSGTFEVTFDPTLSYENVSQGLRVFSFAGVPVSSPFTFSYFASDHEFYLGGSQNLPEGTASGTNDFSLALNFTNSYNPTFIKCTDPDNDCARAQNNASVLVTSYTSANFANSGFFLQAAGAQLSVPEPNALGMVLVGLAVLGIAKVVRLRPGELKRSV